MNWLIVTACAIAAALLIFRSQEGQGDTLASDTPTDTPDPWLTGFGLPSLGPWSAPEQDTAPDQQPSVTENIMIAASSVTQNIGESIGLVAAPSPVNAAANEKAFLDMIAFAEGTSGPNGYRTLFGGNLFESFADHPRQFFPFTNARGEKLKTSAAGRYQFLSRTWDALAKKLGLTDFGPENQDKAALELIRERGALKDVQAGRIATAIQKVSPIWASMPGAGYAQPEKKLTTLVARFSAAGGNLEA